MTSGRSRRTASRRAVEDSFGYRAEKLLRIAEQEAAEVRAHASRESAAIVEQARTEAEKHRHEVEQSLISRASAPRAAGRPAQLRAPGARAADRRAALRGPRAGRPATRRCGAGGRPAAGGVRGCRRGDQAPGRPRTIKRQRDQAAQEISRLGALQTDVRSELARLNEVLSTELAAKRPGGPSARTDAGTPNGSSAGASQPGSNGAHNGGLTRREAGARGVGGEQRRALIAPSGRPA